MTERRFGSADLALILTTALWGLNAVLTKNAVGNSPSLFGVFTFNTIRIALGAVMIMAFQRVRGGSLAIKRRHLPYFAKLSFFGMFLFMVAFVAGIKLSSASNAGVYSSFIPLMILVVSFLSGIDHPTRNTTAGIIVGFAGMLLITFRHGSLHLHPGDLILFTLSLFWAIHTVFGKPMLQIYSPFTVTVWVYIFVIMYQLPFFIWEARGIDWSAISKASWLYLAVSAVCSTFLANSLFYIAVKSIGPVRTSVYTNLTPVFTILLAMLLRGESITTLQTAGFTLIFIGIATAQAPRWIEAARHGQRTIRSPHADITEKKY